jgi:hypothetical protein
MNSTQVPAEVISQYRRLRAANPKLPARVIHAYIMVDEAGGQSLDQFACGKQGGHSWAFDDEDRSYCQFCGLDGDG